MSTGVVDEVLAGRLSSVLGVGVTGSIEIRHRGYTNNRRLIVQLADGRTAFVKQATDEQTSGWLRQEHRMYEALRTDVMAQVLGWDDSEPPILVLEDLSDHTWPPPWSPAAIAAVRAALAELATCPAPPWLTGFESHYGTYGWADVAADPTPFLSVGLCSSRWLNQALPVLLEAAATARLDGDAIVHLDVRSDNLCIRDARAVLMDWNLAGIGNPDVDVAFWLPSLHAEGGPPPEKVATVLPGLAAFVAGFFAYRAGLPRPPTAPRVREVQGLQLAVALPWAARLLGLPAPDGRP